MLYKCINCAKEVDLDMTSSKKVQCSHCGYRILKKVRPQVVKRVAAV